MRTSLDKQKIKVVLLEGIHASAVESFHADGYTNVEQHAGALAGAKLRDAVRDAYFLGIRSATHLDAGFFEGAPRLIGVGCFCIGTNQVQLDAAKLRGVPVFNAPFSNTRSVAELVVAEMIALSRQLGDRSREVHAGVFRKTADGCHEIRKKTPARYL